MKLIKAMLYWVVIVTCILLSVGCNEPEDTTQQNSEPVSECITITICFPPVPRIDMTKSSDTPTDGNPTNIASIREMLVELNKRTIQELNIKIELIWLMNDPKTTYEDQLLEVLGSNNPPDAFYGVTNKLIDEGLAMDITELFPEIAPAYYTMLNEWDKSIDIYKLDDRLYMIPSNTLATPRRYCVIAREDLVDKYLPQGINTLEDYRDFLSAVKANEGDGITPGEFRAENYIESYMHGSGYYHITQNVVGRWADDDIDPVLEYETDEFIAACESYKDLRESRMIGNIRNVKTLIKNGKLASVLCDMAMILYEYPWFSSVCKYRIYPLYMENYCFQGYSFGGAIGINNNSKNADSVLRFIAWLHAGQENYDLFMYGIEDRHYKLSGDSLDLNDLKDVKPIAGWDGNVAFMNYLLERPYPYEPEDYRDFRRECTTRNVITQKEFCDMKGYEYDPEGFGFSDAAINEYEVKLLVLQREYIYTFLDLYEFLSISDIDETLNKTLKQTVDRNGLHDEFVKIINHYKARLENRKCDFDFDRYLEEVETYDAGGFFK